VKRQGCKVPLETQIGCCHGCQPLPLAIANK
jgi:hypothetical protein